MGAAVLIVNVVLAALVFAAVVGFLGWSITPGTGPARSDCHATDRPFGPRVHVRTFLLAAPTPPDSLCAEFRLVRTPPNPSISNPQEYVGSAPGPS
jgi:hypothetical protein